MPSVYRTCAVTPFAVRAHSTWLPSTFPFPIRHAKPRGLFVPLHRFATSLAPRQPVELVAPPASKEARMNDVLFSYN